jgi:hypothetical protein
MMFSDFRVSCSLTGLSRDARDLIAKEFDVIGLIRHADHLDIGCDSVGWGRMIAARLKELGACEIVIQEKITTWKNVQ